MSENTQPGTEILGSRDKVSPSYRKDNRKFHIHRTGAWQDPTGESRYSLCGVQIGPVGREVTVGGVQASAYWNRFCKSCLRLKANGAV